MIRLSEWHFDYAFDARLYFTGANVQLFAQTDNQE